MSAVPRFDPFTVLEGAALQRPRPDTRHTPEPKVGPAKAAKVAKVSGGEGQTLAGLATLAGGTGENPILEPDAVGQTAPTDDPVIWRDWIAERAVILEHDAGKPRAEAERLAYEAALIRWQHEHPSAHADQDRCAACGAWLIDDLLPLAERDTHGQTVWVHASGGCWREYVRKRRTEAETAVSR